MLVVASLNPKSNFSGVEKRRPEVHLCSQAVNHDIFEFNQVCGSVQPALIDWCGWGLQSHSVHGRKRCTGSYM